MAKKKKNRYSAQNDVPLPKPRQEEASMLPPHHALRETIESLAIAFMLAFFIRTFVVEAFVIPTGSMSPALLGVHKDLQCPQCGKRFRVNASEQRQTPGETPPDESLGGMCPICRYTVPFDAKLAANFTRAPKETRSVPNYNGDRIIVNKFLYSFTEPQRWDVVVFKYPGEATQNFIKRLVGLPNETLQVYQGDLFFDSGPDGEFAIERKPPDTVRAMRQIVHDTAHKPSILVKHDWPLRWQPEHGDSGWEIIANAEDRNVQQRFISTGAGESWIRYHHTVPNSAVWTAIEAGLPVPRPLPKLIGDFNPYNTRIVPGEIQMNRFRDNPFLVDPTSQGIHWVGDLMVEADCQVQEPTGELLLELIEAGHRFRSVIDVATGEATLEIIPAGETAPTAKFIARSKTAVRGVGEHRLMFANVDDQLLLWVDDKLVEFDSSTAYDWEELFGPRKEAVPQTSADDPGDLAPVGIGARGASVAIDRLRVYRDIYYIAAKDQTRGEYSGIVTDYASYPPADVLDNPAEWARIRDRRSVQFILGDDQFFVMGDNSPQSSDARLWNQLAPKSFDRQGNYDRMGAFSKPGGNYLERRLLIGRAISVVWPHSWYYVVPGFTDMRRIE